MDYISSKQQQRIKSFIVDINNYLNKVFLSFDLLNHELHPDVRLIDIFSSCIFSHKTNCSSNKSKKAYYNKLNELIFSISLEPNMVFVISDTSIKNNIVTSITYIHSFNSSLKKILHHTINIIVVTTRYKVQWSHNEQISWGGYLVGISQENLTRSLC